MNTSASIKTLLRIPGMTKETAARIRKVWLAVPGKGDWINSEEFPRTQAWIDSCYNQPKVREIKRAAIDEILETHGVELLGIHKRAGGYVYYCNSGDTYDTTILFHGERLSVGCWGDLVERNTVETDQQKIQESFYN